MNPFFHAILTTNNQVRDITEIGETLAYTWFGRPNYAYSAEAQKYWIGSTKDTPSGTTQHITEYNILQDTFSTTKLGTVFQKDDHNQAQIIIRNSDNRLIAFYSEHSGSAIRYRISTNPLSSATWGAEQILDPFSAYSYVSPYQASNGDIFIFFRVKPASTSTWYYMKSTDGGVTFGFAVEFWNAGATHSYLVTNQKGDEIHFTASNGHPQSNSEININCYHCYFDLSTETAYKTDGVQVSLPLNPSTITLVNQTTGDDTSWILDVSFKNNLPRILFVLYPNGRVNDFLNKELWFSEWDGSVWTSQKIADTMTGYIEDDATIQEKAYSGASRFDTKNPDIIWMPKEVNGILEIHKVDLSVNPIYIEQITFDSTVNNWRPISIPSPVNNLLWLKNNDYNMYTDYDISLQTKTVQV